MSDSRTRLIRRTISMLSSMVNSGEQHSPESLKMKKLAINALDGIDSVQPQPSKEVEESFSRQRELYLEWLDEQIELKEKAYQKGTDKDIKLTSLSMSTAYKKAKSQYLKLKGAKR